MKIRAIRHIYNDYVELYIFPSRDQVITSMTVENKEPGKRVDPSMEIPIDTAQLLMDELWNCGFRPSEGSGSAGALAAVQNHLTDLQKIVFKDYK